jgi:hypothetical protein
MAHIGDKQHFWVYMGTDGKGEYSYCDRCGKYRYKGKIIAKSVFLKRWNAGKIKI